MQGIANTLQYQMQKHSSLFQGVLTHTKRRTIAAFVQDPQDCFDAEPTFKQSYAPQSGKIFGILKQMKERTKEFVVFAIKRIVLVDARTLSADC